MQQHPVNSVFDVRLSVRYHQPIGALQGTRGYYVRLERFEGMDEEALIRKAIAIFRERDRWHRIVSANLYPDRWNAKAVTILENDDIAGVSGDAA